VELLIIIPEKIAIESSVQYRVLPPPGVRKEGNEGGGKEGRKEGR
jgi:hypothetical protein